MKNKEDVFPIFILQQEKVNIFININFPKTMKNFYRKKKNFYGTRETEKVNTNFPFQYDNMDAKKKCTMNR